VASTHIVHLSPLPSDLGEVLGRYRKVIVPELNSGQLCNILRAKYLVDARSLSKVQGLPFKSREIEAAIDEALDELGPPSTSAQPEGARS